MLFDRCGAVMRQTNGSRAAQPAGYSAQVAIRDGIECGRDAYRFGFRERLKYQVVSLLIPYARKDPNTATR